MSSEKNVLVDIWLISLLAERLVSEMLVDSPLGVDEFALYGLIVDLSPVTAADIVRGTGLSPTTVSGILARCERRGELERAPNPSDRRSSLLRLTERGMSVYLDAVPRLGAALSDLTTRVGSSIHAVRAALGDLDGAMRDMLDVGPRPYTVPDPTDAADRALDARQRAEVDRYIEWVVHRDG